MKRYTGLMGPARRSESEPGLAWRELGADFR